MRIQGSCVEKEIIQETMPGACRRGRLRTDWKDNIKTWTVLPMEELVRTTDDRDNAKSTSMAWQTLGSRMAREQNRTDDKNS